MNAAEKLMAVKGLIAGLQKVENDLKAGILDLEKELGASTFKTPLGVVSVATPKPKITVVNDAGMLAWAEDNFPDEVEVVRRVRPRSIPALLGNLLVDGADVVTSDGEVVTWATVTVGSRYASATLTADVRDAAVLQVGDALDGLLGLLEIETGS